MSGELGLEESMEMKAHLDLSEKMLPEIKDWQIGKKYKLIVDVEMTSIRKDEYSKDKSISACFTVNSVKKVGDSKRAYEVKLNAVD